jgi:hypothetical protein
MHQGNDNLIVRALTTGVRTPPHSPIQFRSVWMGTGIEKRITDSLRDPGDAEKIN